MTTSLNTFQPLATPFDPKPGMIVTFTPYDDDFRLVASYVPGGLAEDGSLTELHWVDAFGASFKHADIEAGEPQVFVGVA